MAKKKPTAQSISDEYDKQVIKKQKEIAARIRKAYEDIIAQITPFAASYTLPNGVFKLSKLPLLEKMVDDLIKQLNQNVEVITRNGINDMWELSVSKNNAFADVRLAGSDLTAAQKVVFYNPNTDALKAFIERKEAGLSLSDRIYKQGAQYKLELEAGIGEGVAVGRSAADMARGLQQYLQNPDKLFRRVRDAKGVLQLSKNATTFNPGQGVYRSSYKNAFRLARTENNMAYRTSDMKRYSQSPYVIGYEVKLSAQHPKFDICDSMKGRYPVDFKFIGWHPQCLCFSVPVLMTDEQFIQYTTLVKNGDDTEENINAITTRVKTIPDDAAKWINDNKERVAGWSKLPFWWRDNPTFVPKVK